MRMAFSILNRFSNVVRWKLIEPKHTQNNKHRRRSGDEWNGIRHLNENIKKET